MCVCVCVCQCAHGLYKPARLPRPRSCARKTQLKLITTLSLSCMQNAAKALKQGESTQAKTGQSTQGGGDFSRGNVQHVR